MLVVVDAPCIANMRSFGSAQICFFTCARNSDVTTWADGVDRPIRVLAMGVLHCCLKACLWGAVYLFAFPGSTRGNPSHACQCASHRIQAPVRYDAQVDIQQILSAMLSLLEHSAYEGKDTKSVAELKRCLRDTIVTLEQIAHRRDLGKAES